MEHRYFDRFDTIRFCLACFGSFWYGNVCVKKRQNKEINMREWRRRGWFKSKIRLSTCHQKKKHAQKHSMCVCFILPTIDRIFHWISASICSNCSLKLFATLEIQFIGRFHWGKRHVHISFALRYATIIQQTEGYTNKQTIVVCAVQSMLFSRWFDTVAFTLAHEKQCQHTHISWLDSIHLSDLDDSLSLSLSISMHQHQ